MNGSKLENSDSNSSFATSQRFCPNCKASLAGKGYLSACPECGYSFESSGLSLKDNLVYAMRIIGPWLIIGGLAAIWRVDKSGEVFPLTSILLYAAISLIGIGLTTSGFLMNMRS